MRVLLLLGLLGGSTLSAGDVTLSRNEHTIKIVIDDEVFAVYNLGSEYPKPFMHPVAAPGGIERLAAGEAGAGGDDAASPRRVFVAQENAELRGDGGPVHAAFGEILEVGEVQRPWLRVPAQNAWIHQHDVIPLNAVVTRLLQDAGADGTLPQGYDHVHHKGIWLAIDEVNDVDFWAEKGTIKNVNVELIEARGNPARFRVTNHWLNAAGEPLLAERTTIGVHANRLLCYSIEFEAQGEPVTFHDSKEGMFAIRLKNGMREADGGGPVANSAGVLGTRELWGKPASWIDYAGPVAGTTYGVAIMDDPANFRPSRYHVRDYGLFTISPFGQHAYSNGEQPEQPLTLQPGEKLPLHYGLYVHAGGVNEGNVPGVYEMFVGAAR